MSKELITEKIGIPGSPIFLHGSCVQVYQSCHSCPRLVPPRNFDPVLGPLWWREKTWWWEKGRA